MQRDDITISKAWEHPLVRMISSEEVSTPQVELRNSATAFLDRTYPVDGGYPSKFEDSKTFEMALLISGDLDRFLNTVGSPMESGIKLFACPWGRGMSSTMWRIGLNVLVPIAEE